MEKSPKNRGASVFRAFWCQPEAAGQQSTLITGFHGADARKPLSSFGWLIVPCGYYIFM
jgi:hypothetical protein